MLEFVQKQRADEFENVFFAGVVCAQFAPQVVMAVQPFLIHDVLEHGAKHRRGNARPIQIATVQQQVAHLAVKAGGADFFGKQAAIDVGKILEPAGRFALPLADLGVEFVKKLGQYLTDIAAVLCRAALDQVGEASRWLKQAGLIGKHAEQQPHQQQLQRMALVAIAAQGAVQAGQFLHGTVVDGVVGLHAGAVLPQNKGEVRHFLRQFAQGKAHLAPLLQIL